MSLQQVNYKDLDTTSEEELNNNKPQGEAVSSAGPSNERIASQNNKTVHPTQRL